MRATCFVLLSFLAACNGGSDAKDDADPAGDDDDTPIGDDDDTVGDDDDDDDTTAGDDDDDTTPTEPTGDTGTVAPPQVLSVPEVVYGLPNVDNNYDYALLDPTDDDLVALTITPSEVPAGQSPPVELRFTLADTALTRVWHSGAQVAGDGIVGAAVPWSAAPVEVLVEFGIFDVDATLTVEELDANGQVLAAATSRLRAAPMILNHHLQSSEIVVAMEADGFGYSNAAFIQGYRDALGADFESIDDRDYDFDVWVQDEIEFATGTTPDGARMDVVIDSIRDRGLDDYPEDRWRGEQFGVARFSRNVRANSKDSFGNLEVTPPIDGYPFGRIYYGSVGNGYHVPNDVELFEFLDNQVVQQPIQVDTSWLCVGHVDEFMAFVPDATAPRGFRLLYTDTNAAWAFLDTLDPNQLIPQYSGRRSHDYDTIGELVGDAGLRAINDDVQVDYLDPILAQLTAELALTPDEIVLFPGLFEEPSYCGRSVAALIPGMINLVVTDFGGQPKLFMADPFLRADVGDQASDPMIAHVRTLVPAGTEVVFLDDWETYHMALGEVHCGTNVVRTPSGDWWTDDVGGHQ